MKRAFGLVAVLVALVVAGCGSDEEATPSPAEERNAQARQERKAKVKQERQARQERNAKGRQERKAKTRQERQARQERNAKGKPKPEPGEAPAKFTGLKADRYETSYLVCKDARTSKVAKEYGLPAGSDEVTVAETYADDYRADFHQAAFEGCLDGLLGK